MSSEAMASVRIHEEKERELDQYITYLMEHSDAEHPAWNLECQRSWNGNKWNYIDGCMIMGILSLYDITGAPEFLRFADRFVSGFVQENGEIRTYEPEEYSLDNINPGRNFFRLLDLTGHQKYRKAMDLLRSQLDSMPRTSEGNFWHKNIYPEQVWLDGIYMAMPFYMEYEKRFRKGAGLEDACRQILNVEKRMRDPRTGLYYHGYDSSRRMYWADPVSGCSPNFWLRALGWFILGITDCLEILTIREDASREEREILEGGELQTYREEILRMLRELSEALLPWQDASGLFYQLINQPELPGNYLETSGTALISAAWIKAAALGFLPECYSGYGRKCFYGILDHALSRNADGSPRITGICLVAGLGGEKHRDGTAEYYLSEPVVENDAKGVGPLLLAYTEICRMKKGRMC